MSGGPFSFAFVYKKNIRLQPDITKYSVKISSERSGFYYVQF
jgi:hypothetical protein